MLPLPFARPVLDRVEHQRLGRARVRRDSARPAPSPSRPPACGSSCSAAENSSRPCSWVAVSAFTFASGIALRDFSVAITAAGTTTPRIRTVSTNSKVAPRAAAHGLDARRSRARARAPAHAEEERAKSQQEEASTNANARPWRRTISICAARRRGQFRPPGGTQRARDGRVRSSTPPGGEAPDGPGDAAEVGHRAVARAPRRPLPRPPAREPPRARQPEALRSGSGTTSAPWPRARQAAALRARRRRSPPPAIGSFSRRPSASSSGSERTISRWRPDGRRHDEVDRAVLVLEQDEHDPLSRSRPLAGHDEPPDGHPRPVLDPSRGPASRPRRSSGRNSAIGCGLRVRPALP